MNQYEVIGNWHSKHETQSIAKWLSSQKVPRPSSGVDLESALKGVDRATEGRTKQGRLVCFGLFCSHPMLTKGVQTLECGVFS